MRADCIEIAKEVVDKINDGVFPAPIKIKYENM